MLSQPPANASASATLHSLKPVYARISVRWRFAGAAREGAAIDTTTPAGKLVFGIFAALAEFERELISERTQAGLASARARGRKGGRPYKMTPAKLRLAAASMGQPDTKRSATYAQSSGSPAKRSTATSRQQASSGRTG
jgi:DNA invertase Pin-like site-specific DNA recombinase